MAEVTTGKEKTTSQNEDKINPFFTGNKTAQS